MKTALTIAALFALVLALCFTLSRRDSQPFIGKWIAVDSTLERSPSRDSGTFEIRSNGETSIRWIHERSREFPQDDPRDQDITTPSHWRVEANMLYLNCPPEAWKHGVGGDPYQWKVSPDGQVLTLTGRNNSGLIEQSLYRRL